MNESVFSQDWEWLLKISSPEPIGTQRWMLSGGEQWGCPFPPCRVTLEKAGAAGSPSSSTQPTSKIPAPLRAQAARHPPTLPSGPCSTEFSSGIQAGQMITGNSWFLNFISMPWKKWKAPSCRAPTSADSTDFTCSVDVSGLGGAMDRTWDKVQFPHDQPGSYVFLSLIGTQIRWTWLHVCVCGCVFIHNIRKRAWK